MVIVVASEACDLNHLQGEVRISLHVQYLDSDKRRSH